MHRADALGVGEDGVLLAEAERLAVVLQHLLQRRDGSVALNDSHARRERHNHGDGELEIPLTRLLAVRERAARSESVSAVRESRTARGENTHQLSMRKSCMIRSSRREVRAAGIWIMNWWTLPSWPRIVRRRKKTPCPRWTSYRLEKCEIRTNLLLLSSCCRYWPGTSISSNFWYWNSTSQ